MKTKRGDWGESVGQTNNNNNKSSPSIPRSPGSTRRDEAEAGHSGPGGTGKRDTVGREEPGREGAVLLKIFVQLGDRLEVLVLGDFDRNQPLHRCAARVVALDELGVVFFGLFPLLAGFEDHAGQQSHPSTLVPKPLLQLGMVLLAKAQVAGLDAAAEGTQQKQASNTRRQCAAHAINHQRKELARSSPGVRRGGGGGRAEQSVGPPNQKTDLCQLVAVAVQRGEARLLVHNPSWAHARGRVGGQRVFRVVSAGDRFPGYLTSSTGTSL